MKKTFSLGILTIGFAMLVGIFHARHKEEPKKSSNQRLLVFDSIDDNPIGI